MHSARLAVRKKCTSMEGSVIKRAIDQFTFSTVWQSVKNICAASHIACISRCRIINAERVSQMPPGLAPLQTLLEKCWWRTHFARCPLLLPFQPFLLQTPRQ